MMFAILLAILSLTDAYVDDLHAAKIYIVPYGTITFTSLQCQNYDPQGKVQICDLTDSYGQYLKLEGTDIGVEVSSAVPGSDIITKRDYVTFMQHGSHRLDIDRFQNVLVFRSVGSQPSIDNTTLLLEFVLGYAFG